MHKTLVGFFGNNVELLRFIEVLLAFAIDVNSKSVHKNYSRVNCANKKQRIYEDYIKLV